MPWNAEKYTDAQREAMASAVLDRGIRPARKVVALAADGLLVHDGQRLEPFETNESTVRANVSRVRQRRSGRVRKEIAARPPRDQLEALRLRLFALVDRELAWHEKRPRGKVDPEILRQMARALREAAAIPEPRDPTPPRPGQREAGTGQRTGGETTGGLAGQALAAARRAEQPPRTAPEHPKPPSTYTEAERTPAQDSAGAQDSTETEAPGAWVSEQVSRLRG